jgi:hypothetical protein
MADIRVRDKNGIVHVFPSGSSPDQIAAAMGATVQGQEALPGDDNAPSMLKHPNAFASEGEAADFYSGIPEKAVSAVKNNLPAVGGVVGGTVGGMAGGPPGAVVGATVGGAAGRAAQQIVEAGNGKVQPSATAAAEDIAGEGIKQGAYEVGGQVIGWLGKLLKPTARASKLGYAGNLSASKETIESLIPELEATIKTTGLKPKTVGDLEGTVQHTLSRLENEYGTALGPISSNQIVPIQVSNAIRAKITPQMAQTAEGKAMEASLKKRALEYEKPWTIGQLDGQRSDLAKKLTAYRNAAPSDATAMIKLNAEKAADKAANDALNDILYPMADRAANKPNGYFQTLKGKQSLLIEAKNEIVARKNELAAQANQRAGAPMIEKIHTHGYTHPTSGHMGATGSINPSKLIDPQKSADAAVSSAFPDTAGKVLQTVRKGAAIPFSAPGGVNTLPLRYLFGDYEPPDKPGYIPPGQQKRLEGIQKKYQQEKYQSSNPMLP